MTIVWATGGWSLAALFTASFNMMQDYISQRFHPVWQILAWQFATALEWVALTPLILWLTRKFPLGEGKFWRNLPVHVIGGLLIILLRQAVDAYVQPLLGFPPGRETLPYWRIFRYIFIVDFHWSVITYCAALGAIFGTRYYGKYRQGELVAARLEARLAQSQLRALQMQLHPHFLFNTHNAIAALIYQDPEKAERMLGNLSDLLRFSLDHLNVEKIPLKQELDFLKKYLAIEQTRFQDRLRVVFDIAPETLTAIVPNMILQPLVENAIKHGIAPLKRGGTITICATQDEQKLNLRIADDGAGLAAGEASHIIEGVGLSNTKARLAYLYGDGHHFEITSHGRANGLELNLTIPLQTGEKKINASRARKAHAHQNLNG